MPLSAKKLAKQLRDELELVQGHPMSLMRNCSSPVELTPVFGTAAGTSGVDHMLDGRFLPAPAPMPRQTDVREVTAKKINSPGLSLKFRRIWIPNTVTGGVPAHCLRCMKRT